jgi:2-succinyl-5-enolpyruvyl-6-hydroxy-3-cyclohexene-1-carboxylate synthase
MDSQTIWARLLLSSLRDAGLEQVVLSPGSRSTPLVCAALETPGLVLRCLIDERSAAFFALGQARLSGRPSLLICTSGSALCHHYPALVEARLARVPLIVLSADRPFELSDCGAPQTIDQCRAFGDHAIFRELGSPSTQRDALLGLRRLAFQSLRDARVDRPVHLNFRAHKPLEPSPGAVVPELPALPMLDDALPSAASPSATLPDPPAVGQGIHDLETEAASFAGRGGAESHPALAVILDLAANDALVASFHCRAAPRWRPRWPRPVPGQTAAD